MDGYDILNRFIIDDSSPAGASGDLSLFLCSADAPLVQKKPLLVVCRYELLDVSQFVVKILTAELFLLVVGVGLERTNNTDSAKRVEETSSENLRSDSGFYLLNLLIRLDYLIVDLLHREEGRALVRPRG